MDGGRENDETLLHGSTIRADYVVVNDNYSADHDKTQEKRYIIPSQLRGKQRKVTTVNAKRSSHPPPASTSYKPGHFARQARIWKLMTFVCLVACALFVAVVVAPRKDIEARQPTAPSISEQDAFQQLIVTHPDEEVRTDLYRLIATGHLWISHTARGHAAAFSLVPASQIPGVRFPSDITHVPFLNLAPDFDDYYRTSGGVASAQLVIFHEYVHYKQWRDGLLPEDTFFLQPVSAQDLEETCTKKWHAEVDAYHKECEFAREIGLSDRLLGGMDVACHATEDRFTSTLREVLVQEDPSGASCASVWREMF